MPRIVFHEFDLNSKNDAEKCFIHLISRQLVYKDKITNIIIINIECG